MRRLAKALALGAILAGCNAILGIDDPKHAIVDEDVCGDGALAADEQCDDGNTTAGDGCDAACAVEHGFVCTGAPSACASVCGDGALAPGEACDDGNVSAGDGCDDACEPEPGYACSGEPSVCAETCGDGALDAGETCDDKNLTSGDGCSATCQVEHGFACDGAPSVCASTCGDGVVAGGEPCDDENATSGDGCSATCQVEHGFACADEPSVCASTCGDGVVASDEPCDDGDAMGGDGCDASCQVEHGYGCMGEPSKCTIACGDGVIGPGELCDDGDAMGGDGCSAACQIEPGFTCDGQEPTTCTAICGPGCEVEPNNTFLEADARSLDPITPILFTGTGTIKAALNPSNDIDTFVFDLALANAVVRFETFDASTLDCAAGLNTKLTAYDGGQIQIATDDDTGINACSALVLPLTAGAHYVRVQQMGAMLTPAYAVEVNVLSNAGSESESNDTIATADALNGTNVYIAGSHQVAGDSDYFAITVPGPVNRSVRAEIVEGNAESCESGGIASRLTLVDAANTTLADDDLGAGRGACSLIDGTGATPLHAGAQLLPPGVYYLRVRAASGATGAAAQFDYRLALTIR